MHVLFDHQPFIIKNCIDSLLKKTEDMLGGISRMITILAWCLNQDVCIVQLLNHLLLHGLCLNILSLFHKTYLINITFCKVTLGLS